jgi:hypothetical protein
MRFLALLISIVAPSGATLSLLPATPHLFLDAGGIEASTNLTFSLGEPLKNYSAPAITRTYPWEEILHFYTSALLVPGTPNVYRVYYSCFTSESPMYVCVAESVDTFSFTKPLNSQFPFNGSSTNRVFLVNASSPGSWPGSVFLDDRAGVPATEKFKLSYEGSGGDRQMYIATSPDGITWARRSPEVPVIDTRLFSDTQTAVVYDAPTSRYLAFGREDSSLPGNTTYGCYGAYPSLRRVMLAVSNVSADGPYSTPVQVLGPGTPDDVNCLDLYNPAPIVVPGAFLLQPSSYRHFAATDAIPRPPSSNTTVNDGILDVRLAVSRDGVTYSFVSRDPFIRRGSGYRDPTLGSYTLLDSDPDAGFVFSVAGGLLDPDAVSPAPPSPFLYSIPSSKVGLLYWGAQRTHGGSGTGHAFQGVFRATLRREGFVSASSPPSDPLGSASFRTTPVTVPQPSVACGSSNSSLWLLLNARTGVAGSVAITLLDPSTLAPLPGFDIPLPFTGDAVRVPVGWATVNDPNDPVAYDLGALAGQAVVINVVLVHADLYAWEVQCVDGPPLR